MAETVGAVGLEGAGLTVTVIGVVAKAVVHAPEVTNLRNCNELVIFPGSYVAAVAFVILVQFVGETGDDCH
jgi:hypothetical protein